MFCYTINRSSNAVEEIEVDLFNKECVVTFKNGCTYLYDNVSRRAMMNLVMNEDVSLGFWVNNNLVNYKSEATCIQVYKFATKLALA